MNNLPFITVVMPVRNEEQFIEETINQVLSQEYPKEKFEIIVADGLSTDRTPEIVKKISETNPNVRLIDNPGLFPSAGRNVGFKNGKGDIHIVVDGHCLIETNNLLSNLADAFERSGAQCLGRAQPFFSPDEPTTQKAIVLARSSKIGHSSNSFIHSDQEGYFSPVSMGCAYRKEVFDKIGYVDESFDACEDVEFNYRVEKAGFKSFFTPKIAITYFPRETFSGLIKQLLRYGEGRARFMYKHPETVNLDMFKPIALIVFVFLGPISALIHSNLFIAYLVVLFLYISILILESFRLGKKYSLIFKNKILISFLITHFTLGVGLIKGFARIVFGKVSK